MKVDETTDICCPDCTVLHTSSLYDKCYQPFNFRIEPVYSVGRILKENPMYRVLKIDNKLLAKAKEFSGINDTTSLIRESLRVLISRKRNTLERIEREKRLPKSIYEDYLKGLEEREET